MQKDRKKGTWVKLFTMECT